MTTLRITRVVAALAAAAAVLALVATVFGAVLTVPGAGPLALALGPVNLVLAAYVAALGWLLARYSLVNLRGQRRLARLGGLFAVVLASLLVMVLSADLVTLAVGWTVSGLALSGLVSHAGTAAARRSGRQVLGWLLASSALVWAAVAVASRDGLATGEADPAALGSGEAAVVVGLLLAACVIRSALVPFHRWLPETAAAPSPISALLHAGVVNVTGVVAVLQWPLLSAHGGLLAVLGVLGLVTAVWSTLEQRVRPDVKGRLAASTSAQMGWMAVQVGVGVPAAALLHMMGHGAWKAWLFLRAGGAVVRARRESVLRRVAGPGQVALSVLLAVAPLLVVIWWITAGATHLHPGAVLVAGLGLAGAVAAGWEAARLERCRPMVRQAVAVLGGTAAAAYVAAALAWERGLSDAVSLQPEADATVWLLAAAGLVSVVLLATVGVRLGVASAHPVATLVAATALPPRTRLRGMTSSLPAEAGPEAPSREEVEQGVRAAAAVVGPAWPLRATVAASPLARLEGLPFDTAITVAERVHRAALRPSLEWFLELYEAGDVSQAALDEAVLEQSGRTLPGAGGGASAVVELTRTVLTREPSAAERAEVADDSSEALAHAHVWSARAWHRAEDRQADRRGPWALWRAAAGHPVYALVTGSRSAVELARSLPEDPVEAVRVLLPAAAAPHETTVQTVSRILGQGPGWLAHAQWRAERCGTSAPLMELVALRMALSVLEGEHPVAEPPAPSDDDGRELLQQIWQRALDATTRDRLTRPLLARAGAGDAPAGPEVPVPDSQSVWCIDVRSERMRRALERQGRHETFGFAGFFGVLGRSVLPDGRGFDQCPAIVSPTVEIDVPAGEMGLLPAVARAATRVGSRPGVAFAVAEAAGAGAFAASVVASVAPRRWRALLERTADDGHRPGAVDLRDLADPGSLLSVRQQADAAEGMLRTIGLTEGFAPTLLLCAHGSTTENNAFASAYDCGACGGNPGLLNAVAMAQILNDEEVRAELSRRGISLPPATRVVAASHDTTRDLVRLVADPLDEAAARPLGDALRRAGELVRSERAPVMPLEGRAWRQRTTDARAVDWSEPMPEWGLSGCAAIIVGPRRLTQRLDLDGRVFLHSYDRELDPDGSILAGVVTAPVVVSQMIAAQYWFSSVAPAVVGAGDKTTHNAVGDIGVLTGAHGDLRLGLPWQALFGRDPGEAPTLRHQPQHVPSRHLVVIDADPRQLARIVRESPVVRNLVVNEWMRMVAVDGDRLVDIRPALGCDARVDVSHDASEGR